MRIHCRVTGRKVNGWWMLKEPYRDTIELPAFALPEDTRVGDEVTLARDSEAAAWRVVK